jgi:hypothetical protein
MIAAVERRRLHKRKMVLASSVSAALALFLVAAVVAWRLRLIEAWVR